MARKQNNIHPSDIVVGVLGILMIWSGASTMHGEPIRSGDAGVYNWWIGLGLTVLGSMVLGVAIHRVTNALQNSAPAKAAKKATKRGKQ